MWKGRGRSQRGQQERQGISGVHWHIRGWLVSSFEHLNLTLQEDDEELSPLPKSHAGEGKTRSRKGDGRRLNRQTSTEESLSHSRWNIIAWMCLLAVILLLEVEFVSWNMSLINFQGGTRRWSKKASEGNKRCSKEVALRYLLLWCKPISLLPFNSIFLQDDASESMKEMSTRARRTRKSAQEEAASGRLERQTSKDNRKDSKDGWRDSKDDISKKVSHDRYYFTDSHYHQHFFVPCLCHQLDNWHNNHTCTSSSWAENYNFSTLKRRNTGKKMDADKVRF